MLRHAFAAALLSTAMAAPAFAANLSQQDQDFLKYAAHDNQGEIQICLVAEKQAENPAVKAFARLMVDDHVQVESDLASVINSDDVQEPNDIGRDAQQTLSKLEPLNGAAFDRQFIAAQIQDHTHDIQRFTQEEQSTKDAAIRRFAIITIPVLKQHLALAQAVQSHIQQDAGSQQAQNQAPQQTTQR